MKISNKAENNKMNELIGLIEQLIKDKTPDNIKK